jgi:hypothetical protein
LRLNPFAPIADVSLMRHIDLLKAVFNASFPMFAGMSYVLEEAMLEIYTDRGWNLLRQNPDLTAGLDGKQQRDLLYCLVTVASARSGTDTSQLLKAIGDKTSDGV